MTSFDLMVLASHLQCELLRMTINVRKRSAQHLLGSRLSFEGYDE